MNFIYKYLKVSFFVLAVAITVQGQARRHSAKIKLKPILKTELNKILAATNELHTACFKQNEPRKEAKLKNLINTISRASKKTSIEKNQATHLNKMLNAAKTQLELAQMNLGEKRQENIKQAFRQLVQLAKVYQLDKYQIFFCSKDKSVWLQKGWRAKNPINPENLKDCGKLVR